MDKVLCLFYFTVFITEYQINCITFPTLKEALEVEKKLKHKECLVNMKPKKKKEKASKHTHSKVSEKLQTSVQINNLTQRLPRNYRMTLHIPWYTCMDQKQNWRSWSNKPSLRHLKDARMVAEGWKWGWTLSQLQWGWGWVNIRI